LGTAGECAVDNIHRHGEYGRAMLLREYLSLRGLTIPVLADLLGVSVQSVHRYVNGERLPRPDVMMKIAEVTGGAVKPNDFYPVCCREPLEAA
jgi:transcriptional regulator with XRE-family HTH domain